MKVALVGLGSVGRGVAEMIAKKDLGLTITGIADSKSGLINNAGIDIASVLATKRKTGSCGTPGVMAADVVAKAEYDALIEVTPTNALSGEPATGYIRTALNRKKHVVTSNKGPVALYYKELRELARKNGVEFRYEATVAGAIPIMHVLEHGLAGNEILAIYGILNGTCNFILTRMADEGLTYEQALLEARELGYAEADPTYDVQGIDAAIKLVILANTIWGNAVKLEDVDRTGIDLLTADALRLADEQGCTIRLIAEAIPRKNLLRVSPRILEKNHPLVTQGTLNALTLEVDMAKEITLIGRGAGSVETASAIIGDLLFIRNCHVQRP
ncbi:homoserine dehydrogenase [Methanoregula sp.]|uniref:homoserine dehydrogenase n=1 Tax=Methanoregula sp. TaxID=2052170 RepID=UPI000CB3D5E6|nr:homoserine dehydrogenase [Methanoregula sp.]PKG32652.1 MAG: homoserine dehydrogenase [Methanoregula sp.]